MNWTKPSEEQAVSVLLGDDDMKDKCICCGSEIPKGTKACPNCLVSREHIQTNYESIIAMSAKELAEFVCENTKECGDCVGFDYCRTDGGHANGLIAWLKKEVQNGEE